VVGSAAREELLVQLFCSMAAAFPNFLSTGAFRNAFSSIETAVKPWLFSVWLGLELLVLACFTSGVCVILLLLVPCIPASTLLLGS